MTWERNLMKNQGNVHEWEGSSEQGGCSRRALTMDEASSQCMGTWFLSFWGQAMKLYDLVRTPYSYGSEKSSLMGRGGVNWKFGVKNCAQLVPHHTDSVLT